MTAEEKLVDLNLDLPPTPKPMGLYKPILILGPMVYTSGHGPLRPDGTFITGRIGEDLISQEQGYQAARQTGLAILSSLRAELGSLDRVRQVVKIFGMVNSTPEFTGQSAVLNGCSELLARVFGESVGVGTRSAVGVASLPGGIAVEIEAVFAIE